jgi:Tol biopolymer transport system component
VRAVRIRRAAVQGTAAMVLLAGLSGSEAMSAPSERMVFTQSPDNGFSYYVYTTAPTGGARRRISTRRAVGRPSVSADGTRVAFAGPRTDDSDGRYSIYVVGVNGSGLRRVTAATYGDMDPAWSPNGRWIAFSRSTRGNLNSPCCLLGKVSTDGRRTTRLINHTGGGTWPSWSPDSRNLVFAGPGGVRLVRADGAGGRLLVRGSMTQPAWSPSGHRIALVQRTSPSRSRILTVNSTGGAVKVAADPGGMVETPTWSPDSRSIFFIQYTGLGDDGRRTASVWRIRDGRAARLFRFATPLYGLDHWGPRP